MTMTLPTVYPHEHNHDDYVLPTVYTNGYNHDDYAYRYSVQMDIYI